MGQLKTVDRRVLAGQYSLIEDIVVFDGEIFLRQGRIVSVAANAE
jgi:hypothetical protein